MRLTDEEVRRRGVEVGRALALEGGLVALSFRAVGERVGVSKDRIWRAFGTTDGLWHAVARSSLQELDTYLPDETALDRYGADVRAALLHFAGGYRRWLAENEHIVTVLDRFVTTGADLAKSDHDPAMSRILQFYEHFSDRWRLPADVPRSGWAIGSRLSPYVLGPFLATRLWRRMGVIDDALDLDAHVDAIIRSWVK